MTAKSIDAIIVTYNSAAFLRRLASSLRESPEIASVTIVDNDSRDNSVELASSLDWGAPLLIRPLGHNVGFGAAMNIGAFENPDRSPQILVVNPDVEVSGAVLGALSEELERVPQRAAIGVPLTTADGRPVSSARDFPHPITIARRSMLDARHNGEVTDVDWLCGALMLWKRQAFESIGGFSSEFFLYFEDVDICKKASVAGWKIAIDGRYGAIHDQGHAEKTSSTLRRANRKSRRQYARKWFGMTGALAAMLADATDAAAHTYHLIRRR